MRQLLIISSMATFLAGCASYQLNSNTLEIGSTVESLQTKQVLHNISKFIDNPDTIPDQIAIASGTITTLNVVTPSFTDTKNSAVAIAATTTRTKTVTSGLNALPVSDQWQQAWSVQPVTDGDDLWRLRALYKFAAGNERALDYYPKIRMPNPNYTGKGTDEPSYTGESTDNPRGPFIPDPF